MTDELKEYYRSYFEIGYVYDQWAQFNNITSNTLFVIYILFEFPDLCTQRFICNKLFLPKQTVNSILDTLENKGYISKKASPLDKREKVLSLTKTGVDYAHDILFALYQFEENAFASMDEKERKGMIEGNAAYCNQLSQQLELAITRRKNKNAE